MAGLTPEELARGEALLNQPIHAAYTWLYENGLALIAAARECDTLRTSLEVSEELRYTANLLAEAAGKERDELRAEVERLRSCVTSAEQAAEQAAQAAKLDRVALRVLLRDLEEAEDLHEFLRIKANAATVRKPAIEGDPMVAELAAEVERLRVLLAAMDEKVSAVMPSMPLEQFAAHFDMECSRVRWQRVLEVLQEARKEVGRG